jgi:hypothetical protein
MHMLLGGACQLFHPVIMIEHIPDCSGHRHL